MRGYFGIGVYQPKFISNIGTLWRTADNFGAQFIYTIGKRYTSSQRSDTGKVYRHIPLFHFDNLENFIKHIPRGCQIICIEMSPTSRPLTNFCHPTRAIYLLGAEDTGIPNEFMKQKIIIEIPNTKECLNVATAGAIVMYDRINKGTI